MVGRPKFLFGIKEPNGKNNYVPRVPQTVLMNEEIRVAVLKTRNKGAVYTDELALATGISNKTLTLWLTDKGFRKDAGSTSKRWVNEDYV